MSFTAMLESRNNLAVPPVEMSSTPIAASLRANSTNPVLSVTLRMARWIFVWVADMADLEMNGNVPGNGEEILTAAVVGRQSSVLSQESPTRSSNIQRAELGK